jgi:hypothetical protein
MHILDSIKNFLGIITPLISSLEPGVISAKHDIKSNGEMEVIHDSGFNPDGSKAITRWNISPPQLKKHAVMFIEDMNPGELSAFTDAVNEFDKQKKS